MGNKFYLIEITYVYILSHNLSVILKGIDLW